MPAAKWLQMLLQHVPDQSEHRVRYYGRMSQDRSSSERTQRPRTALSRSRRP